MLQSTILLIILSAIIALALAWFQYFYKGKRSARYTWILTFLRAGGIFAVLLLLINPKITHSTYFTEKPNLLVAVDNSSSIANSGDSAKVVNLVSAITDNPKIRDRFNVSLYSFGNELNQAKSFGFTEAQTNIQDALKGLDNIYKNTTSPTVLISDGNQTFGGNYQFQARSFDHAILPVIVGDTAAHQDFLISRVNVNRYAFLQNKFPVEVFLNYSGNAAVQTRLLIKEGNTTVFSTEVEFDQKQNSHVITALLPANSIGVSTYEAQILPMEDEKNTANNKHGFAVEVIDERSSILVVSSLIHPDLGVLKESIETNQQRQVEIVMMEDLPANLEEFELVILYQPTREFEDLWESVKEEERNYWVITGPETDWRFVNQAQDYFKKEVSSQTEEFFPELNPDFATFQLNDIGYSNFPPLVGAFGEMQVSEQAEILLYQQVQGISTETPLLALVEEPQAKKAFLFGTNIWKWRAQVFLDESSFESFDNLIGKLVQFLASTQRKDRLSLNYENVYYGNENILLSAQYFDENYNSDPRGKLNLELTNLKNREKLVIPMSLIGNKYQVKLGSLPASDYSFIVRVEGENLSASGTFSLLDFEIEKQFTSANVTGLQQIADAKGTELYFAEEEDKIIEALLADNNNAVVQKSRKNHVSLIEWYYLLAITLFFFSAEWFLRKYHGLI